MEVPKDFKSSQGSIQYGLFLVVVIILLALACAYLMFFKKPGPKQPETSKQEPTINYLSEDQKKEIIAQKGQIKLPDIKDQKPAALSGFPQEIAGFVSMVPVPAQVGLAPNSVEYVTTATGYHIFYNLTPSPYLPPLTLSDVFANYKGSVTAAGWQTINSYSTDDFAFIEAQNPRYQIRISNLPQQTGNMEVEIEVITK